MGWSDVKAGKALKPGQWKCTACYVVNESVAVMCVSCETDRPGFEAEAAAERKALAAAKFAPPSAATSTATNGKMPLAAAASAGLPVAAPTVGGVGGFKFGVTPGASSTATPAFKFGVTAQAPAGTGAGGFKFGVTAPVAAAAAVAGTTASSGAGGFKFGVAAGRDGMPQESPAKKAKVAAADGEIYVKLADEGKLGLTFIKDSSPLVVKAVSAGGLADAASPGPIVGMVLMKVQGTDVSTMPYCEAVALIQAASRPLSLAFRKPGQAAATTGSVSTVGGFKFGVGTAPAAARPAAAAGPMREPRKKKKFRVGVTPGAVIISGSGDCGQIGLGKKRTDVSRPLHVSLLDRKNITMVVAGGMHTLALDGDGQVWSWGCNDDYTLGRVDQKDEGVPRPVKALAEPVVQMSAGASHSAVLTAGGDVYTWGTYKDSNGHIGFKLQGKDLVFKQQLPEKMEQVAGKGVHQIASGSDFTLALTRDGLLYGWGDAENGNIGGPIPKSKPEKRKRLIPNGPIRLDSGSGKRKHAGTEKIITSIAAGGWHSLAIDDEGNVLAFGLNNYGQCGTGDPENNGPVLAATVVKDLIGKGVTRLAGGQHHSMALLQDGTVMTWGRGDYCQLGIGPLRHTDAQRFTPQKCYPATPDLPPARWIDAGDSHCLLVTDDDALFTWGFGTMGALCNGEDDDVDVPQEVDDDLFPGATRNLGVMAAVCGGQHTVALVV